MGAMDCGGGIEVVVIKLGGLGSIQIDAPATFFGVVIHTGGRVEIWGRRRY